jgi:nucleotide-binding universal stress UspA family protein
MSMFTSIVVGTDGSDTASEAVRQAIALASFIGARIELVSAYEPVPKLRLREESVHASQADANWMVNVREDVLATLESAAADVRAAGIEVEVFARQGDPADAILDVAEERGSGAQQGLPPRTVLGADHPDGVAGAGAGGGAGAVGGAIAAAASTSPAP